MHSQKEDVMIKQLVANDNKQCNVLILLSTGKLGSGICDAFLAAEDDDYEIFGCTRDVNSHSLLSKGVTPLHFIYGDKQSIQNAIKISKPDILVVITACSVAKSLEEEFNHGKLILDTAKEERVPPHVILTSSVGPVQGVVYPEGAWHLHSKRLLEEYIKQLDLPSYCILRSSSFYENLDDPTVHNPLFRGFVSRHDVFFDRFRVKRIPNSYQPFISLPNSTILLYICQ